MKRTAYTRQSPSPRYRRLLEQYRRLHQEGEKNLGIPAALTFAGQSLPPQAPRVKAMILRTQARSILDYGSGKGRQYDLHRIVDQETGVDFPDIKSYWGVSEIRCYDPGYARFSEVPQGTFDGVICTDVLEHCPEDDIGWIVDELFAYARMFVFATVACFPARKQLPSGGNAHCTIKPVAWWKEHIARAARIRPGVLYEFRLAYFKAKELSEAVIAG